MKKIIILSIIHCLSISIYAQCGIYQTADDYLSGQLAYKNDEPGKHAIRTDIPFNPSAVKVIKGSEKFEFDKWNIYGFRKKNRDYRFYESKTYRIVDPQYFPIYAREELIIEGKAKYRKTKYYFSTDANAPLQELTIRNLKHAFPNRDFHGLIDLQFRRNAELLAYDPHYGEYKLKSIYSKHFN